jgi:hypothetical protein
MYMLKYNGPRSILQDALLPFGALLPSVKVLDIISCVCINLGLSDNSVIPFHPTVLVLL